MFSKGKERENNALSKIILSNMFGRIVLRPKQRLSRVESIKDVRDVFKLSFFLFYVPIIIILDFKISVTSVISLA